jgi:DNA (cytosine-5)-methyltransferase 1
MNHIDLFTGIGGFSYAARMVWGDEHNILHFVEYDRYCQELLKIRFKGVPIHGDIKTFKAEQYRGTVDLVTGGFPCQPFSAAGRRGGTEDDRYLWPEMFRVIQEAKPRWVVAENVFGLVNWNEGLVLEQVLSDLETEGYETQTFVLPACAVNAPHRRDRVWIVAYTSEPRAGNNGREITDKERRGGKNRGESIRPGNGKVGSGGVDATGKDVADITENTVSSRDGGRGDGDTPGSERTLQAKRPDSNVTDTEGGGIQAGAEQSRQAQDNGGLDAIGCDNDGRGTANAPDNAWNTKSTGQQGGADRQRQKKYGRTGAGGNQQWDKHWIEVATELCGVDDGLPAELDGFELSKSRHRVERLKALGNAIVPQVVVPILKAIKEYEQQSDAE